MTIIQTCTCCSDLLQGRLSRRGFMQGAAAGAAALTLAPFPALAAEGKYEAMTLSCIDPRTQEGVRRNMLKRHLIGKYSQVHPGGRRDRRGRARLQRLAQGVLGQSRPRRCNCTRSRRSSSSTIATAAPPRSPTAPTAIKTRDAETKLHQTVLADFRKQVQREAAEARRRDRPDLAARARSRCSPDDDAADGEFAVSRPATAAQPPRIR